MADPRFLLIRLGSLGDIVHAIPAAAALRDTFPESRIDWVVEPQWTRLLEGNSDLSEIVSLDRKSARGLITTVQKLRSARYTCAIDFQALYKSAILAFASGAPRRIGFQSGYAREGMASWFYTDCLNPRGAHKIEHNLTLVEAAGAQITKPRFSLHVRVEDEECVAKELTALKVTEYYVLNPGGGWRSKCWPPERYGELYGQLSARYPWQGIVSYGPGEDDLAQRVVAAAGTPAPFAIPLPLGPLMALLRGAKFVVSADTGPLHLACALGAPVIGLFGPTDPSRNGPFSRSDVVVRNPRGSITTYRRGDAPSPSMLSITVDQVFEAVGQRMGSSA